MTQRSSVLFSPHLLCMWAPLQKSKPCFSSPFSPIDKIPHFPKFLFLFLKNRDFVNSTKREIHISLHYILGFVFALKRAKPNMEPYVKLSLLNYLV